MYTILIILAGIGMPIGIYIGYVLFAITDWEPIWAAKCDIKFTKTPFVGNVPMSTLEYEYTRTNTYEILYSKDSDRYKLVLGGDDPKGTNTYIDAVNKLNEFKNSTKSKRHV